MSVCVCINVAMQGPALDEGCLSQFGDSPSLFGVDAAVVIA